MYKYLHKTFTAYVHDFWHKKYNLTWKLLDTWILCLSIDCNMYYLSSRIIIDLGMNKVKKWRINLGSESEKLEGLEVQRQAEAKDKAEEVEANKNSSQRLSEEDRLWSKKCWAVWGDCRIVCRIKFLESQNFNVKIMYICGKCFIEIFIYSTFTY